MSFTKGFAKDNKPHLEDKNCNIIFLESTVLVINSFNFTLWQFPAPKIVNYGEIFEGIGGRAVGTGKTNVLWALFLLLP